MGMSGDQGAPSVATDDVDGLELPSTFEERGVASTASSYVKQPRVESPLWHSESVDAASGARPSPSLIKLREARHMLEEGLIDEADYAAVKQAVLNSLGSPLPESGTGKTPPL